jgi:glycosyltransferase involved in cell wall biosynthesis
MKITFVLPTVNLSGGIRVAAIYARWLTQFGHQVVVVSPPAPLTLRDRLFRKRTAPMHSHFDGSGLDHRVLDRARAVEDRDVPDADVVICTWWETAEWVARLAPAKGAKIYFVQHHEVFDWLPVARSSATYRLPMHKIVIAAWLERVMAMEYGQTDVSLVPNSVDHAQFFAPVRGKREHPTVGFLYSKAQFKGIDVSLQAITKLRALFPDLQVLSFGDQAPRPGELPDGIELHLAPAQDSIRELYARCDVWMTASRSEGFNLPAMEAMACRTPVVATRTGWPEEAIVDGVNGWCVDVDDADALAQAAQRVLALADDEWRSMSAAAFDTVRHSSWENSARLFEHTLLAQVERSRR